MKTDIKAANYVIQMTHRRKANSKVLGLVILIQIPRGVNHFALVARDYFFKDIKKKGEISLNHERSGRLTIWQS